MIFVYKSSASYLISVIEYIDRLPDKENVMWIDDELRGLENIHHKNVKTLKPDPVAGLSDNELEIINRFIEEKQ